MSDLLSELLQAVGHEQGVAERMEGRRGYRSSALEREKQGIEDVLSKPKVLRSSSGPNKLNKRPRDQAIARKKAEDSESDTSMTTVCEYPEAMDVTRRESGEEITSISQGSNQDDEEPSSLHSSPTSPNSPLTSSSGLSSQRHAPSTASPFSTSPSSSLSVKPLPPSSPSLAHIGASALLSSGSSNNCFFPSSSGPSPLSSDLLHSLPTTQAFSHAAPSLGLMASANMPAPVTQNHGNHVAALAAAALASPPSSLLPMASTNSSNPSIQATPSPMTPSLQAALANGGPAGPSLQDAFRRLHDGLNASASTIPYSLYSLHQSHNASHATGLMPGGSLGAQSAFAMVSPLRLSSSPSPLSTSGLQSQMECDPSFTIIGRAPKRIEQASSLNFTPNSFSGASAINGGLPALLQQHLQLQQQHLQAQQSLLQSLQALNHSASILGSDSAVSNPMGLAGAVLSPNMVHSCSSSSHGSAPHSPCNFSSSVDEDSTSSTVTTTGTRDSPFKLSPSQHCSSSSSEMPSSSSSSSATSMSTTTTTTSSSSSIFSERPSAASASSILASHFLDAALAAETNSMDASSSADFDSSSSSTMETSSNGGGVDAAQVQALATRFHYPSSATHNSPAFMPGCGMYSEYIHDLRTVCTQCSASGRLKSKKKPLVDSLLLLAFFGDGIKKTTNGNGYIIEDSNLARELMNSVSTHIRPPSRGTNNSYDNWKRAMGKTFRKSGTYFTPKDEDTARYARHVEEHLARIFERKKQHQPNESMVH